MAAHTRRFSGFLLLLLLHLMSSPQASGAGLRLRVLNRAMAGVGDSSPTTTCVPINNITAKLIDHDGDQMASEGDCLRYPDSQSLSGLTEGQVSTAKIPDGSGRVGQFALNSTCRGLTLVQVLDPSEAMSVSPDDVETEDIDLKCPAGEIAVRSAAAGGGQPAARITTTTGRGVGVPVSSCSAYGDNYEEDAGLCYPRCRAGYSGAGPLCLRDCPHGFRDDGLYCAKPGSYGRGGGGHFGLGSCPSGQERNGLLCYPKCRANFHAAGCCVCSPDCPRGFTDIGVSCQKGSYGRGAGKPLKCPAGSDYDAGLCYRQCPSGAHGVGPLCYAPCTADQPFRLGIWCYHSESERNEILGAIIGGVLGGAVLAGVVAVAVPAVASAVAIGAAATVAAPVTIASSGPLVSSIVLVGAIAL